MASIDNNAIRWRRERSWFPVGPASSVITAGSLPTASGSKPYVQPMATTAWMALFINAATDGFLFQVNLSSLMLDRKYPIGITPIWSSDAATTTNRQCTWKALYNTVGDISAKNGSAIANSTLTVAPATALDTIIGIQTATGVAKRVQRGNRGIIGTNAKGSKLALTDWLMNIQVDADVINAAFVEQIYLLGIELDFVPLLAQGRHTPKDPQVEATPLYDGIGGGPF